MNNFLSDKNLDQIKLKIKVGIKYKKVEEHRLKMRKAILGFTPTCSLGMQGLHK